MADPTATPAPNPVNTGILGGVLSGVFDRPGELESILSEISGLTASKDKNTQTTRPSISSTTDANAKIRAFWVKNFDRQPTEKELNKWRARLIKAQKANPSKQSYTRVGDQIVQTSVSGLNVDEWLSTEVASDPVLSKELEKVALTPREVAQRADDKAAYERALAQAGGNPSAISALEGTTQYGLDLRAIKNRIQAAADKAGAIYDENDLLTWAKEAYDTNQDSDAFTLQKFLDSKFKFGGKAGYKGEALDSYTQLRDTAFANGLDLNKAFGGQVDGWIKAINDGANIDQFKQTIRNVAKIGMPDKVAGLIDQGVDLQTIYSPYQNVMESILELPRGSVTLDDPTLRGAIGPDKEMTIYEFQRALRKDPRWQYTDNARESVSNAALGVLRDFGFMG